MKYIGGGKPKAGNTIHKEANSSRCYMSSVGHRTATVNLVGRYKTVVSSSLTPQAALLVPISGPIDPVVDCRGFTGSAKDHL